MDYANERSEESKQKLMSRLKNAKEPKECPLQVYNIVATMRLFPEGLQIGGNDVNFNMIAVACQLRGKLGQWTSSGSGATGGDTGPNIGVDQKFPSCVSRCREMHTTNSLFSSGAVVMAGAREKEVSLASAHLLAWRLKKDLGLHFIGVYDFDVCNVVTSFGLGYLLHIPRILKDFPLDAVWTPEKFRGLAWKYHDVSFVLFRTGMAVITGARTFEKLNAACESAKRVLLAYRLERGDEDQVPALLSKEMRAERGVKRKSINPIAERKEEMRLESFEKQEAYQIQKLREKTAGGSTKVPVKTKPKPKAKAKTKPPEDKPAPRYNAPSSATPSTTELSFRWKTIDTFTTLMAASLPPTTSTTQPPTQTAMIGAAPLLLPGRSARPPPPGL
jgi:TATA-box binding protein (TBP) (component of TFIID and TFIIIB)